MRLEQAQAEAKRHFENYVSVRDQLNQLMEKQQMQLEQKSSLTTPDNRMSKVTPTSMNSVKSNRLRQDLGMRAFEASMQEQ